MYVGGRCVHFCFCLSSPASLPLLPLPPPSSPTPPLLPTSPLTIPSPLLSPHLLPQLLLPPPLSPHPLPSHLPSPPPPLTPHLPPSPLTLTTSHPPPPPISPHPHLLSPPTSSLSPFPQVLSSQLMPTQREVDEANMQVFRRNFLEVGGLKSVINVLQRNALPSSVDLTIRQDCYAIALSLARWVWVWWAYMLWAYGGWCIHVCGVGVWVHV